MAADSVPDSGRRVLAYRRSSRSRLWWWIAATGAFISLLAALSLGSVSWWIDAARWAFGGKGRQATPVSVKPDWFAGKHEDSADGRFRADGLVYYDKGRSWCTMEVVEIPTKKRIFYLEQPIGPGDRGPMFDQGNAFHDGIEWAPDSSAVTFEGKNGQTFVVPVR